jgi:hypothetical protein
MSGDNLSDFLRGLYDLFKNAPGGVSFDADAAKELARECDWFAEGADLMEQAVAHIQIMDEGPTRYDEAAAKHSYRQHLVRLAVPSDESRKVILTPYAIKDHLQLDEFI